MTTMFEQEVECCICGEKSSHMGVSSTNTYGSPDLDTRPPDMERSTVYYWIQRCPSCGYSSSDLSECNENTREIIESSEYREILGNDAIPEVAASFLALSYEKQKLHQYPDSAWSAIYAAWVCDDEKNHDASRVCREEAISMIKKGSPQSQVIAEQEGASEVITIDLMRRAGMFKDALELAEETKTRNIEDVIIQIIKYEEDLINMKDIGSHTISEAVGDL